MTAPALSSDVTLPGIEVYVDLAGVIDVEAEAARKRDDLVRLETLVAAKEKKLANANFVGRAPAEVVQKERDSLKDLQDQLAATAAVMERLRRMRRQRPSRANGQ